MRSCILTVFFGLVLAGPSLPAEPPAAAPAAEEKKAEAAKPVEIPRDPTTIDPVTSVPAALAKRATVEFKEAPLKDVVKWLQSEQKLSVVIDQHELKSADIQMNDPVSEKLEEEPVYLLLDRLKHLGIGWYYENQILHITTTEHATTIQQTSHLNIGDLLDAGYQGDAIIETITEGTAGPWQNVDGEGGAITLLGDVLFLRQTGEVLREVEGLLNALRKHGQRTFAFDSPQHAAIRAALQKPVSISYEDAKLSTVLADLSKQSGVPFRFDQESEKGRAGHDRTPVSIQLTEQKMQTVLDTVLQKLELAWILRDGVLWITSAEQAASLRKAAVFDVRDLCRNEAESMALQNAIETETRGPWRDIDGDGASISFPKPGAMVIRGEERLLDDVLEQLENYRTALRASKPRTRPGRDPQEVVVRFYKLPAPMAKDLSTMLPDLVRPETWKGASRQTATGSLKLISVGPEPSEAKGVTAERSVLVVTQTREVQRQIADFIQKVQVGVGLEASDMDQTVQRRAGGIGGGGMGGMGGGGGSFGGGFFQVPK